MSNFNTYYEGDDPRLKAQFEIDGVSQTPSSATIKVVKTDGTVEVADATAVTAIVGDVIEHQLTAVTAGQYVAYITADFGDDKRTGILRYSVKDRDGQTS